MSYILSALKKAEQERHSGGVPDVLTPQAVQEPAQPAGKRGSRLYLTGGVAVAALLSLWLANTWRSGGDTAVMNSSDPLAGRSTLADELIGAGGGQGDGLRTGQRAVPDDAQPAAAEPSAPPALSPQKPYDGFAGDEPDLDEAFAAHTDNRDAGRWAATGGIPDLAELPPSLRKHLPRLKLTGHLYSLAHQRARKVILNGVALKEKQYLDDDLMVSEITPDGVILDFQGRLFRLGADQMFR